MIDPEEHERREGWSQAAPRHRYERVKDRARDGVHSREVFTTETARVTALRSFSFDPRGSEGSTSTRPNYYTRLKFRAKKHFYGPRSGPANNLAFCALLRGPLK